MPESKDQPKKPTERSEVDKALERLRGKGVQIRSYTVYPGKGSVKANVTIELRREA